jgi:hypothetical protein
MSHQLTLTAVGASNAYNLAISGLFLISVQAQLTRARESQDAEDWAAGTLHRRRALARARRRRRREVEVRPYKPPLPYRRFSFNLDLWSDTWVERRMRFTKAEIAEIIPYLRLDGVDWKRQGNKYRPSPTKALTITLARLAFPLRHHDMIHWFGCSSSQLSTIANVIYCYLVRFFRNKLFFVRPRLDIRKIREFAAAINELGRR